MKTTELNRRQILQSGLIATLGLPFFSQFGQAFPQMNEVDWEEIVKINANENPYGPSKSAQKAVMDALTQSNRYAKEDDLVKLISEREKVAKECIVLGHGSTELLYLIALCFGADGKEIVIPEITFFGFTRFAQMLKITTRTAKMNDKMEIDLAELDKAIGSKTNLIYVANPNNPTGTILQKNALMDFCESAQAKTTVFIDEAYIEFANSAYYGSVVELIRQNKNILITRTFSKIYGLAGLRVGYLIAKPEIAQKIKAIRVGLLNVLGIAAAIATYKDQPFVEMVKQKNEEVKSYFTKQLQDLGFTFLPTPTNFLYVNVGEDAEKFSQKLAQNQINISAREGIQWARFTIGTQVEMNRVVNVLKKFKS